MSLEGRKVVGPVERLISGAVEVCGRRLVLISLDPGPAPNFAVPASLLNETESLIRAVPSARQKTSASSDSTRLHWGQRFILGMRLPVAAVVLVSRQLNRATVLHFGKF